MGKHLILILKWALHYALVIGACHLLSQYVLPSIENTLPPRARFAVILIILVAAMTPLALQCVREFHQGVAEAEAQIALRRARRKDLEH